MTNPYIFIVVVSIFGTIFFYKKKDDSAATMRWCALGICALSLNGYFLVLRHMWHSTF